MGTSPAKPTQHLQALQRCLQDCLPSMARPWHRPLCGSAALPPAALPPPPSLHTLPHSKQHTTQAPKTQPLKA